MRACACLPHFTGTNTGVSNGLTRVVSRWAMAGLRSHVFSIRLLCTLYFVFCVLFYCVISLSTYLGIS